MVKFIDAFIFGLGFFSSMAFCTLIIAITGYVISILEDRTDRQ